LNKPFKLSRNMSKKIAETEKLLIREFELTDTAKFFELNRDIEVVKYTGDRPFESIEVAETLLTSYIEFKKSNLVHWAIVLKENNEFIGTCGFEQHSSYVDLGGRLFKKHWGKGYATESAKACLDYGFKHLNLSEVVGRVVKDNLASIRVLEKIGMKFWKKADGDGIPDSLYYRIQNH